MRHAKWCKALVMTLCLICSLVCCATGVRASDAPDALRIHAGWTAPAPGYYLTDSAMRNTVAGWTEARKIADVRQQALEALHEEIRLQQADLKRQLIELQSEINAERRAYRSRIRGSKIQGFLYGTLVGFGSGYLVRRNNP